MIAELCLFLKIVMNGDQITVENITVLQCTVKNGVPLILSLVSIFCKLVTQDTTVTNDVPIFQKSNVKVSENGIIRPTDTSPFSSPVNSLWIYEPASHNNIDGTDSSRRLTADDPRSLTQLSNNLALGYEPSFKKGYFDTFEKRPRPVTLVAFRKSPISRNHVNNVVMKSSETAELQSPYNEVGNFWNDEPNQ